MKTGIPAQWSKVRLGNYINVLTDYHANGSYKKLKENVQLLDEPDYAVMIRTTNFEKHDFTDDLKYIDKHAYEYLKKSKVRPGDILMNKIANAGSVYYMPNLHCPVSLAMNLFLIRTNHNKTDQRYIYYYLKGNEDYIKLYAIGTAAKTITKQAVRELEILLPPLPTQRKIASILSAYDDLIENNLRQITILEEMAQSLYREWFVKYRFPGHKQVRMVDSPLGKIPEGWDVASIVEVCDSLEDGDWVETKDQGGSDYRLLQVSNIGIGKLNETGNFRYITEETFNRLRCTEVVPGDILISRMPKPTGRAWLVTKMPWRMVTAVDIAIAKVNQNKANPFFLVHHLNSHENLELIEKHQTGTTRPRISRKNLGILPLICPPPSLQERFQHFVSIPYKLIISLDRKNRALQQTRDMLLPRLISGELDVSELDIETPESIEQGVPDIIHKTSDSETTTSGCITTEEKEDSPDTLPGEDVEEGDQEERDAEEAGPLPITEWETDEVMAAFRKAARGQVEMERDELIREVSLLLGYRRLGTRIQEVLRGHMRAAVRRHIIRADGTTVWLETPRAEDYEREELINTLLSVMRKNREYYREDVIYSVAKHLGFERIRETVVSPIRSAINGAIRRGLLGYQGDTIWRED